MKKRSKCGKGYASDDFTPGPWEAYETEIGYSVGKSDCEICDIVADFSAKEMEANAQLISAAPEMLKVLIELQECSEYWSEYDVPLGIHYRIKVAIAKAKGESE
jgi:hypothetical protein